MSEKRDRLRWAAQQPHWFHAIEVLPGVWTRAHKSPDYMALELAAWRFPDDLTGKTVLDIGCADGGFSTAALKRGAASVLAIDEQKTFGMTEIDASCEFPSLEFRNVDLFSDAFMALPRFDFIIFTGVLYHVHDMLEALKRVRLRAAGTVLLETHVNESLGSEPPLAVFYEHDELGADPTNWWGPNLACLEAMLRTAGFAFERSHLSWENETHANGRVSYLLTPIEGSVFGHVAGGATGSQSMLHEAYRHIEMLEKEIAELRVRLT